MTGENENTLTSIQKLLVVLQKDVGKIVKVQGIVEQLGTPYRGNIVGALANIGLIKWEAKGMYTVKEFAANQSLAMAVRTACLQATSKSKKRNNVIPIAEYKAEQQPEKIIREIVREPSNPFGFTQFDEIMIEKGSIIIGEYTLTGSFTLTRNKLK